MIDRPSWASDGSGPTTKGFTHVFHVDATVGGTPRQVTTGNFNHTAPAWAADGKSIFVSGIRKPDAEYLDGDSEIYAVNLATEAHHAAHRSHRPRHQPGSLAGRAMDRLHRLRPEELHESSQQPLPDGLEPAGASGCGSAVCPARRADVTWAPDGSGVYYSMQEAGEENTWFAPADQGLPPKKITNGTHVLSAISLAKQRPGGRRFGRASSSPASSSRSRWRGRPKRASWSTSTATCSTASTLADAEELRYVSKDGLKVQGWLMKPANFDPAKKYPLVLWIHGGPWSMYSVGWNWAWQNFAANGYAVLWTNPRGSTGYGQDFVNGIQYSYPDKDYDDLMAGVDAAIAKGWIDPDNLFVCGGSGGGVLTAWIVGHTTRFRAAVSMRPVIDWHSFVGTTDGTGWYRQFKKIPVGRPDGVCGALAAALRRQRHDADDADDRRGGLADADLADRGVLPRAEDAAEGRHADGADAGGVPRLAAAVAPVAAAAVSDGLVREVPDAGEQASRAGRRLMAPVHSSASTLTASPGTSIVESPRRCSRRPVRRPVARSSPTLDPDRYQRHERRHRSSGRDDRHES